MTDDELMNKVSTVLQAHTVCSLATCGGGTPWVVSLMYSADFDDKKIALFWLSDRNSHHSAHLADDARCAVAIARQYDDFGDIHGLQMTGTASVVADERAKHGLALLSTRYPFLSRFAAGKLAVAMDKAAIYQFVPDKITLIDNRVRFGFKETLEFPLP